MEWKQLWLWMRPKNTHVAKHSAEDPPTDDLARARAQRAEAERKLRATQAQGPEVARVSATSRRIRAENNFSARWGEAMGRWNGG